MKSLPSDIAQEVIACESYGLQSLMNSLEAPFNDFIQHILNFNPRLVWTGVGKSGWVAQKIVATMHSVGIKAAFMHPSEAIHGDLGMLLEGDFVLFISKSGESEELKTILPIIKSRGLKTAAICSRSKSYLASEVDFLLLTPSVPEADPFDWVPTTSTTVQMALGDAIAITLMKLNGTTEKDFARNHPGGLIGKSLLMSVKDLIKSQSAPSVIIDEKVHSVLLTMSQGKLGATAVLDQRQRLVGIITDGDIRRMILKENTFQDMTAQDMMTSNPLSISIHAPALDALDLIRSRHINHLLVIDEEDNYQGILHIQRLIEEGFG